MWQSPFTLRGRRNPLITTFFKPFDPLALSFGILRLPTWPQRPHGYLAIRAMEASNAPYGRDRTHRACAPTFLIGTCRQRPCEQSTTTSPRPRRAQPSAQDKGQHRMKANDRSSRNNLLPLASLQKNQRPGNTQVADSMICEVLFRRSMAVPSRCGRSPPPSARPGVGSAW